MDAPDFDESPIAAFERVAATFPSRVALSSDVWEASYQELNETANRLAHRLIALGVAPDDRVAILMSHDAPAVAAVLGILKVGSIVLALDRGDPVSRLKMLVEDAEPNIIVTDGQNCSLATNLQYGCSILNFESETATGRVHNPSIEIAPEQTAFITYTSGHERKCWSAGNACGTNWQRNMLLQDGKRYQEQIAWWKDLFLNQPRPLNLPFYRAEPLADVDPNEGVIPWGLEPDVSRRLKELGHKESATYYVVRLAAFAALLAAETGDPQVVLGTYLNCRRHESVQEMLGLFTNPVTVILNCDLTNTFRQWLLIVRRQFLAVQAHGDIPYEWLRREMHKSNVVMPEIRAMLTVGQPHPALRFARLEMVSLGLLVDKMFCGFDVKFAEHDEHQRNSADFDAGIYDPTGVRDLIGRFKHLLDAVSREPDVPINELLGIPADQLRERALEHAKCERARFLEQHRALRTQLQESEADRAARLKVIEALTDRINQLEDDRALQLTTVVDRLNESEADRAARLKVIKALTDQLKESEAGRASVNGFIRSILSSLRNHNKPRPH